MYKMDAVTSPGEMSRAEANYKQHSLVVGVRVRDPCSPSLFDGSATARGTPIAKAIRQKHYRYRWTNRSMVFKSLPLAFSTTGN